MTEDSIAKDVVKVHSIVELLELVNDKDFDSSTLVIFDESKRLDEVDKKLLDIDEGIRVLKFELQHLEYQKMCLLRKHNRMVTRWW